MPSYVPFPESEELVYKFLCGINFSSALDNKVVANTMSGFDADSAHNVQITYLRLPTVFEPPHVTFFLYETKYYTNSRNDLLGVNRANYLFSCWGHNPDQAVILSRECELALHNFPPWKIAWRILTNLKSGSGGSIDTTSLDSLTTTLSGDRVDPIDNLLDINTTLDTILNHDHLGSATNANEVKTSVENIIPYIDNFGFTLCIRNKLDNLRPQQLESGYYERLLEVEFLNGG